ncbi:MAG: methyl-accepting chemotaxis protein [Silicimonas sp.]|nr:methyl-accepting chemotaxis protein [Silicimonas sp.]
MADQTKPKKRSLPIFAQVLLILVGACATIAATLTWTAEGGYREIATFSFDTLAEGLTEVTAEQLSPMLIAGDMDGIHQRLDDLAEVTGVMKSYVVTDAAGTIATTYPKDFVPADHAELMGVSDQTLSADGFVMSHGGFSMAAPIHDKTTGALIGSLAIEWEPSAIFGHIAEQRLHKIGISFGLVLVLAIVAGFLVRRMVTSPLEQMTKRTAAMAGGDLTSEVPALSRGDEIGVIAGAMENLRGELEAAEEARVDAAYQRAGFQSSSTPNVICNRDLVVTHANRAFLAFAREHVSAFAARGGGFDPEGFIGTAPEIFHLPHDEARKALGRASFPLSAETGFGDLRLDLTFSEVTDESGNATGYVVEYSDVTETRKTEAILSAMEEAQLRADFDAEGRLARLNGPFQSRLGHNTLPDARLDDMLRDEQGAGLTETLGRGTPVFGKVEVRIDGETLWLEGSISPVRSKDGETISFVLLGTDVTRSLRDLAAATEERERRASEQAVADKGMREALTHLSDGDLRHRINAAFASDYEPLRSNFNSAVDAVDTAVAEIMNSADSILGEADNVTSAAEDLSKRTEQQAATLEETAAAISELTTSVASAAEGAGNAQKVVLAARENAEASGLVVQEAVDAMGEIEASSNQISRIIDVIDEIAFQTNLLALNAGVEAARAGDAGRGFAVVASEVRSLALRSSNAAHEITDLISTSGDHVKRGVSLVDKAGQALTEIVSSVGNIAEHVTSIAASTKEQSTGLDEISTAMNQLDQVTQRNVAMFEETMAATQTVQMEANTLVGVTGRFECSRETPANDSAPKPAATAPAAPPPQSTGNLALATEEAPSEDNWEDF